MKSMTSGARYVACADRVRRRRRGARRRPAAARAPVYTAAQAAAGRAAYTANCAAATPPISADSNEAPPLAGADFMNTWRTRTHEGSVRLHVGHDAAGRRVAHRRISTPASARTSCSRTAPRPARTAFTATTAVPIGSIATGQRPRRRADRQPRHAAARTRPGGRRTGAGGGRSDRPRRRTRCARGGRRRAWRPGAASARPHGRRRSEELRAGHRRDAAQPATGDWLMARRNYQALELQPARTRSRATT